MLAEASRHILGAFSEKEASNHAAMWGMVLGFSKAHSDVWRGIEWEKTAKPKLMAFLGYFSQALYIACS